jgi:hypothetical protein
MASGMELTPPCKINFLQVYHIFSLIDRISSLNKKNGVYLSLEQAWMEQIKTGYLISSSPRPQSEEATPVG